MTKRTYFTPTGQAVEARPGEYILCDCYGRYLRTVDYLSSGLGLIYRANNDGSTVRIFY